MRTLTLALLLTVAPACGCVSATSSQGDGPQTDRHRITREQLQALPSGTAFDAVERFHRECLRGRAATIRTDTGRSYPHLFVDGRPYGTLDTLRQLGIEAVEEIRFITASDATTRYGTGYPGGIIDVTLRRSLAD